jgi:hypothetical protein
MLIGVNQPAKVFRHANAGALGVVLQFDNRFTIQFEVEQHHGYRTVFTLLHEKSR